ncbi:uncharacterized protein ISCGN_000221 [Ixodes scapularis]
MGVRRGVVTERRCSTQAASAAPTASHAAAGGTPRNPAGTGTSRGASEVSWAGSPPPTTETARAASFTCSADRPFRAVAGSRAGCESTRKVSSEDTTQAGTRSEFGAATKTSAPTTTAAQVATDEPSASKTTMETPSTSWSSSRNILFRDEHGTPRGCRDDAAGRQEVTPMPRSCRSSFWGNKSGSMEQREGDKDYPEGETSSWLFGSSAFSTSSEEETMRSDLQEGQSSFEGDPNNTTLMGPLNSTMVSGGLDIYLMPTPTFPRHRPQDDAQEELEQSPVGQLIEVPLGRVSFEQQSSREELLLPVAEVLADKTSADEQSSDEVPADVPGDDVPGDDAPGYDVPVDDVPVEDGLVDDGPVDDVPGDNVPGDNVPGDNVPGDNVPGDNVPGDNVPGDDVPGDDVPGDDVPGDDVPGDDVPGDDVPVDDVPGHDMPIDDVHGDDERGDDERGDDERGDDERGDDERGDDERGDVLHGGTACVQGERAGPSHHVRKKLVYDVNDMPAYSLPVHHSHRRPRESTPRPVPQDILELFHLRCKEERKRKPPGDPKRRLLN